jgi:hypothetical protein
MDLIRWGFKRPDELNFEMKSFVDLNSVRTQAGSGAEMNSSRSTPEFPEAGQIFLESRNGLHETRETCLGSICFQHCRGYLGSSDESLELVQKLAGPS